MNKIVIENNTYKIIVLRKRNKNTYIKVDEDLNIIVSTNYLVPNIYINKLINDNIKSITKMINTRIKKNEKEKVNENELIIFGTKYNVVIKDDIKNVEICNNNIYFKNKKEINKYITLVFNSKVNERIDYYYHLFEEDLPKTKVRFRKMKTRWGVCNYKDNVITINTTLLNYPLVCLDYVIIHELSHYIYHDHSLKFWSLVEKYMPFYKKVRKYLKGSEEL